MGVPLAQVGRAEVWTTGGRRIDIVTEDADGATFVIENQYGRADHDHLTRGLAYAVAAKARGLVVVAEEHRDEFRAVGQYLNDLAQKHPDNGISVWLVEAQAIRIDGGIWAPMFTAVVGPNDFVRAVEQDRQRAARKALTPDEFLALHDSDQQRTVSEKVIAWWTREGHKVRYGSTNVRLGAPGPSKNGSRTVVVVYADGTVSVPLHSYAGQNTGIPIASLTTDEFRAKTDRLFGFSGTEQWGTTAAGWLNAETAPQLRTFCLDVAAAYADALLSTDEGDIP
ncbi:hypothetical protein [Yimella sp. cx-51]|uniref:hypothetical protein n=1 Tax=Yimella sp. cx-51 TaxID=2770551 RepID=UPI001CB74F37|nr:hypothetical protein [Yimella sp. cx-51]